MSDGVSLFTESCRPNKTLLSTSLSRLASLTGRPLADETQRSKIGQLPVHRCHKWLRSHTTHHITFARGAVKHLDNPNPQTPAGPWPVGAILTVPRYKVWSSSLVSLANISERKRDPVFAFRAIHAGNEMSMSQQRKRTHGTARLARFRSLGTGVGQRCPAAQMLTNSNALRLSSIES